MQSHRNALLLSTRHTTVLLFLAVLAAIAAPGLDRPAAAQSVAPVFRDGQAQVVPAFEDPEEWIRQELWVETEFD